MFFHGFAWIQHEFGMNLAPVWFQVLYKALWNCKNETSMNFAWAQQWNSTWTWNQHEINMNPAWLRHDFNTNMVSISVPSNFRDDKFKIVNSQKGSTSYFFSFQSYDKMNWKDWKNHTKRRPCPQLQTTNPNSQWYVSWKRIIPFVGVCWTDRGWEILVDGKSCPGGQMLQDYYSPGWNNPHSTMAERRGFGRHSHRRSVGVPL